MRRRGSRRDEAGARARGWDFGCGVQGVCRVERLSLWDSKKSALGVWVEGFGIAGFEGLSGLSQGL